MDSYRWSSLLARSKLMALAVQVEVALRCVRLANGKEQALQIYNCKADSTG